MSKVKFKVGDKVKYTFPQGGVHYGTVLYVTNEGINIHYKGIDVATPYDFKHFETIHYFNLISLLTPLEQLI